MKNHQPYWFRAVFAALLAAAACTTAAVSIETGEDRTREDCQAMIESYWDPSDLTPAERLSIFESFSTTMDERFACFQDLDVDWDAIYERYQDEIPGDISKGRFSAVMNQFSLALPESHTWIGDSDVQATGSNPCVSLLVLGDSGWDFDCGAGQFSQP